MADKIMTIPRSKLDDRIGRLADPDILQMNRASVVFLGLAGGAFGFGFSATMASVVTAGR
jgi:hypothetical protein